MHGKTRRKHSVLEFRISRTKSTVDIHSNLLNKTTVCLLTTTFVIINLPLDNQIVLNKTYLPDNYSIPFRLLSSGKALYYSAYSCHLPPHHYTILNRNSNFLLTTRYILLDGSLTTRISVHYLDSNC